MSMHLPNRNVPKPVIHLLHPLMLNSVDFCEWMEISRTLNPHSHFLKYLLSRKFSRKNTFIHHTLYAWIHFSFSWCSECHIDSGVCTRLVFRNRQFAQWITWNCNYCQSYVMTLWQSHGDRCLQTWETTSHRNCVRVISD